MKTGLSYTNYTYIAVLIFLLTSCTGLKETKGLRLYLFPEDRSAHSSAPVSRQREVHTVINFVSYPPGTAVYAYDARQARKDFFIGRTPCSFRILTFEITEYANMTTEYGVVVNAEPEITKPVDFSDPKNNWGEITFSFQFEKREYASRIQTLAVKATNEILVRALAGAPVPAYALDVKMREDQGQ
jgi:hypothetical protein